MAGESDDRGAARAPHVALLSSPGMGHVVPVAELARRLHAEHGFTATVVTYILQPLQDRTSDAYCWMVHHGERYRDADGILVNTFDAIEPNASAILRQPEPGHPPVYPVGPVIRQPDNGDDDATGCIRWLDTQPDKSVLFVSFGSGGALSAAQMDELARGLELSGQRFLWVVRSPTDSGADPGANYYDGSKSKDYPLKFLPSGFLERTKEVGLVVPSWAPQVRVLGHRATGAMLTHCGWNSVLESVMHGVPMIAWPLYAEQRQNAVMLHEEIKVALRPKVRGADGMILGEDITKVVNDTMNSEEGDAMRTKVTELQKATRSGLAAGGMSHKTLNEMVTKWKERTFA
ncbi:unnamed protein product [Triticum turgidum subsp. durum]|uniref:UDP-glycosyltransferases domain-containing protein n=1 Tax=Triticum turgidum subsp. durum TaxID=4567 RepID=A0A9R0XV81_TRITD|nr:unnamed protein product [Triticum turgidum subsp. durum]